MQTRWYLIGYRFIAGIRCGRARVLAKMGTARWSDEKKMPTTLNFPRSYTYRPAFLLHHSPTSPLRNHLRNIQFLFANPRSLHSATYVAYPPRRRCARARKNQKRQPGRRANETHSMHLMYIPDPANPSKRIYTLKKVIDGEVSKSAHPARFSPDDKYSRHRVTIKKRYGLLLTQQSMFFSFFLSH